MGFFRSKIRKPLLAFLAFLRHEHLFRLMGVIVVLVLSGALGFTYFEEQESFADALWWAIVTVTTVGFGDISPTSLGGRLIGAVLMLFGIGVLGMFTATIAGVFVEERLRDTLSFVNGTNGQRKFSRICGRMYVEKTLRSC